MSIAYYLWAIPVFGLLIFIHELGHFAVAKWTGVKVEEFALGFGPRIAGFQMGETRYNLRVFPLGGFVRMAGMEDGDPEDPRGFNRKPLWARALVMAAGPVMNLVLAALLIVGYFYFIGPQSNEPVLGGVEPTCPALVGGPTLRGPCPAYAAGMSAGDRILVIDDKPVASWEDILNLVTASGGRVIGITYQHGSEQRHVQVQPVPSGARYIIGIRQSSTPLSLGQSLVQGPVLTAQISVAWLSGLGQMITGRVRPELSGPVGITRTIAEQAQMGLENLLFFTAFLSINLGLFNLLPVPMLDGSRLVFLGIEAARGRRVDPARENMVHFVGFLLLIGLMIAITFHEVIVR
ncbi:MAG: M50 family metallopeptidase [Mycobacterium leprae]